MSIDQDWEFRNIQGKHILVVFQEHSSQIKFTFFIKFQKWWPKFWSSTTVFYSCNFWNKVRRPLFIEVFLILMNYPNLFQKIFSWVRTEGSGHTRETLYFCTLKTQFCECFFVCLFYKLLCSRCQNFPIAKNFSCFLNRIKWIDLISDTPI